MDDAKEIPEDALKESAGRWIPGGKNAESGMRRIPEHMEKDSRAMGRRKYFRRQM